VLRYLDASLAIDPDAAGNRVRRMITARKLGRLDVSLADARWLLEQAPSDVDLDRVRQLVAVLEAAMLEATMLEPTVLEPPGAGR